MCDSSQNQDSLWLNPANLMSLSTGVFPSITDFAGHLNFQIVLNTSDSAKKKWLYSDKLKKVFIDINKTIALQFTWFDLKQEDPCPRFIRALPVYTQDDWLRIPVERCPMHRCYEDNLNANFPWVNHVLRCDNEGTQYEVDGESHRRSCITPVALEHKDDVATLHYKFVCKTSCYRGMQRRPVVVIFTLEDVLGNVLGRRCLSFKVCSCLKRDLYREENGLRKRKSRKLASNGESLNANKTLIPASTGHSTFSDVFTLNNSDTRRHTLTLSRLKKEYLISMLKTTHNVLLGQFMRDSVEGNEVLITQLERLLNRLNGVYNYRS